MSWLRSVLSIARKDLQAELRTKEALNAALSFVVVMLLLFSFAFQTETEETRAVLGGLLWLIFAFAAVLLLNRTFARELPNDCLDVLIASPVPASALFLGKAIASFVLLCIVEAVALPVFGIFYNVYWGRYAGPLIGTMLLGSWGLAAVGTMLSAITVNLRLREVMLPVLLYPMLIPALLGAIELTNLILAGQPVAGDSVVWVRLLISFDVIYTALGLVLIDNVVVG